MKNSIIIYFVVLCSHCFSQEIGNNKCLLLFDTAAKIGNSNFYFKAMDIEIRKNSKEMIFEWPNIIGPAIVDARDSLAIIECFASLIKPSCENLEYFVEKIATVSVNINNCSIEIKVNKFECLSDDAKTLCGRYESVINRYKNKKKISKKCSNSNYMRIYMYQLTYASLHGSDRAKYLFEKMKKDCDLFDDGLDAIEYRNSSKIIEQLLINNKSK
jgi:hypothetical protein